MIKLNIDGVKKTFSKQKPETGQKIQKLLEIMLTLIYFENRFPRTFFSSESLCKVNGLQTNNSEVKLESLGDEIEEFLPS